MAGRYDGRMSSPIFDALTPRKSTLLVFGVILILSFGIYGASLFNDFVRLDDGILITENPAVQEISPSSLAWIFTHYDPELYIPLSFLSYQFDYIIGGRNPFIFHLTSLVFHALNACLVYILTFRLSRKWWVGVFCGLLFAVHPLHTEAVAWASGRKDVLSGFFFLGSLCLYVRSLWPEDDEKTHAHSDYTGRICLYLSILLFFFGLLSKVSIILLPGILFLIDSYKGRTISKASFREKIPYILLSIIFGIIALYGKRTGIIGVTLLHVLLMAARSTIFYLQKLLVPTHLSVLSPTEREIAAMYPEYFVPVLVLVALAFFIYLLRKNRTLVFGILFFFLMVAPSFQNFAKDGDYFFASDRYAYLGSIGIFFLINTLWFSDWGKIFHTRIHSSVQKYILVIIVAVFGVMSHAQAKVWSNTEMLFRHAAQLYPHFNARAYNNLGNAYRRQNRTEDAIAMFKKAIEISPRPRTLSNLGAVYRKEGMIMEARETYRRAIDINPDDAEPYFGLGLVYAESGDLSQALTFYQMAIDREPNFAEAYNNRGSIFLASGDMARAIAMNQEAIKTDSLFVQAYFNLGVAFTKTGYPEEAIHAYESAIILMPDAIPARINLGILLYNAGRMDEAKTQFKEILERDPGNINAQKTFMQ